MTVRTPRRGDVFWIDFDPARGVEQRGRRPGVVVQNDRGNEYSAYTVVAAISSSALPRVYPFTVPLSEGEANLPRASYVNCAQLLTIDQSRLETYIGHLHEETMARISSALRYELEL